MPAFGGRGGLGGFGGAGQGAKAWGDQADKTKAAPGSNPLPATPGAPAAQVYGGEHAGGGFGGGQQAAVAAPQGQASSLYSAPPSGHWDIGEQGAEGAWSNGYNPHWAADPQAPAPAQPQFNPRQRDEQHPQAPAPQSQSPAAPAEQSEAPRLWGADGSPLAAYTQQNPRGSGGFGDARDNPNNTMSLFETPDAHRRYYDFDNPALQVSPGGTLIGKDSTSEWDPRAIYKDQASPFYIPPDDPRWNA